MLAVLVMPTNDSAVPLLCLPDLVMPTIESAEETIAERSAACDAMTVATRVVSGSSTWTDASHMPSRNAAEQECVCSE